MPVIMSDGCPLQVEVEGPDSAPALMFSNSLGADLGMWEPQVAPFARHFRVIRYDRRGHGRSGVTPGPYTMEQLGRDELAILDGLGLKQVNLCGISMGGMVAQWVAANAPERISRLVLSNTACYYADKNPWNERIKTIRDKGLAAIVDTVMGMWFTQPFHEREPQTVARFRDAFLATPLEGYVGCGCAVRDMDHREILGQIKAPTLVIASRHDRSTPIEAVDFVRSRVPGAQMTILDAAHIANVEQAAAYNTNLLGFLTA